MTKTLFPMRINKTFFVAFASFELKITFFHARF